MQLEYFCSKLFLYVEVTEIPWHYLQIHISKQKIFLVWMLQ